MKTLTIILSLLYIVLFSAGAFAQFDLDIGKKIEKKVNKEVNKAADDAIDEGVDAVKKGVEGEPEEKDKGDKDQEDKEDPVNNPDVNNKPVSYDDNKSPSMDDKPSPVLKVWSNYDFVSGDEIIFEDDFANEQNGEFPSRWDLLSGSAEIASLGEDNVIHLNHNNSIVLPLMDKKDFLTDVFTFEFDAYFEKDAATRSAFYKIRFFEGTRNYAKIDGKRISTIDINWNSVKMGQFGGNTTGYRDEKKNWNGKWKHIAISFNERSLKLYMDEERLLNIPNLGFKPKMFSIGAHFDERYIKMSSIKNIRVNEGGKKLYDRIMSEGKYVTRGILFEVNKAEITGESMGVINKMVKLMKKHEDLKFSIEGHTDSDGDDSFNQKLSEDRAASIMNMMIQLGIDASRLETKGYGESNPVSDNSTPEGKANNRRVEFVKI